MTKKNWTGVIWYIKPFYQKWMNMNALRSELSRTHYRLLLSVLS